MIEYAKRVFYLSQKVSGSELTNFEHLKRVAQAKKIEPEQLYKLPEIDETITYLFDWFTQLQNAEPITYSEIKAWSEMTETLIYPEEVKVIKLIDSEFHRTKAKQNGH